MATQATIPVRPATRDRVRELKGHQRTYDDLLSKWADQFDEDG